MVLYQIVEFHERHSITRTFQMRFPIRNWGWSHCQMVKKVIQQYPIVENGWKVEETFNDAPSHTCRFSRNSDEPIIYCYNKKREIATRVPKQNLTAENLQQ